MSSLTDQHRPVPSQRLGTARLSSLRHLETAPHWTSKAFSSARPNPCNLQVDEAMDVIAARRQERLQAKVRHAPQHIVTMSLRLTFPATVRGLPAPCSSLGNFWLLLTSIRLVCTWVLHLHEAATCLDI